MSVRPVLRALWRGSLGTIALALCALVVFAGVSAARGYRPVVVLTGSMGGTAPAGSLAIAGPTTNVEVGDVIVMRGEGRPIVTHRVVRLEPGDDGVDQAVTRGDANPDVDPERYPVVGRQLTVRWVVPGLGRALMSIRSPLLGLTLSGFVVLVLVGAALRRIWTPAERRRMPVAPKHVDMRPGSRRRRAAFATLTAASASVTGGGVVLSLYASVGTAAGNEFSTLECYDARLGAVQRGSVTSTTNGISTVAISPVDPDRSFVLASSSSSSASAEPDESTAIVRLAGPSSIEIVRASDGAPPGSVEIEWSVVEYACGVSVQHGTAAGTGATTIDVPITPVDVGSSFVTVGTLPTSGASAVGGPTLTTASLTGAGALRIQAADAIPSGSLHAWQVVTFEDPGDVSVQTVTGTLGSGTGTTTLPIPAPVAPSSTMLIAGVRSTSTGPVVGDRLVRARLLDGATIEVQRQRTDGTVDVSVQVVELRDGSTVQHGVLDLAPGQAVTTATIPPVSVDRSTAVSTVHVPGSASGGSTSMAVDDVVGEASARVRLVDARTVEIRRGATSAAASFAWQVVTWGGPSWADLQSPFRRRLDVTAGTVLAPDGYTTSFVLDHATMVDDGMSLADGGDLRVWRYDGVSWIELDRVLDDRSGWDRTDTTVWFRTQEPIAAGQTVSYWLYFGNETPSPAPADPANVWLVSEGFDDGTLGAFEDRTGGTGWYRALPWTRRIVLTIPAGRTPADLAGEAVLVHLADADIATHAQPDGSDLRFTAADGTTVLAHELEAYDSATGAVTAWVQVPTVSAASPTQLHLYYGAADAPELADPRTVWDGEAAVFQLAADPAGASPALDDVSPGRHDGVALADVSLTTSPAGPAAAFDGALDRFESSPLLLAGDALTVSTWFRADTSAGEHVLVAQGDPTTGGVFELAITSGAARLRLSVDGDVVELTGGAIGTSAWHHVAATWDGDDVRLHVDGAQVATAPADGSISADGPAPLVIGADPAGSTAFDGTIGQVRLDDEAWGAARITFRSGNVLAPAATVLAGAASAGTWFDQGDWGARYPLVVESDLVAGPLTDYPLLVQLTNPAFTADAQADGDDLVVTAADGTTRLDHQLERWDPLTGELTAWVRLPALGDATDTVLYLYLDNPTAVDQQDATGVWGPDADLVVTDPTTS